MNRNYARIKSNVFSYAPSSLTVDGAVVVNPSGADYAAAGWMPVEDAPPAVPEGKVAVPSGWHRSGGRVVRDYAVEDAVRAARRFSKYRIVGLLKELDKWVLVKTWIEERGYYDYYLAAQDFAEDDERFAAASASVKALLGVDDATFDGYLERCLAD